MKDEDTRVGILTFLQFFDLGDGQERSLLITLWSLSLLVFFWLKMIFMQYVVSLWHLVKMDLTDFSLSLTCKFAGLS